MNEMLKCKKDKGDESLMFCRLSSSAKLKKRRHGISSGDRTNLK